MKTLVVYTGKYIFLPILFCATCLLFPVGLQAQFTPSTTTTLPAVLSAAVAWGDYDNDGDLDILLTGQNSLSTAISQVYKNAGNGVFTTAATLTGVSSGAVAWGDYDNDGDLDILLTGLNNSSVPVSIVYRNDGNDTFTSVVTLTGIYNSSVAWGDYDNDGDLDILMAGQTGTSSGIARIYRNNGNDTFTQTVTLAGVYNGAAAAWGDYDNDGRLDVMLAGQTGLLSGVARIYRNAGNDNFSTSIDLPNLSLGISQADAVWGDYDNDGDLDLLVSGNNLLGLVNITTIYRNDGNNTFTASASLLGLLSGSAAWGDYDNDGDLDILQTGISLGLGNSRVYRNDNNDNFEVGVTLTGLLMSSAAWGDHDNDGDLDILIAGDTGLNPLTILYNNTIATANTAPTAPSNVQAVLTSGTSATLSWSRATDAQTPQNGISYTVSVGNTLDGIQVKPAHANLSNGYRRVPELGNVFATTATSIVGLTPGQTYYWRVQSIDAGLLGSTFASGSFFTPTTTAIQLVVSNLSSTTPLSGSSITLTVGVQNSYGQTVAVTQATTVELFIDNPYLTFGSGSTQATVQAGESGTTLTLTVNSTSTANVTAVLTVSSPDLSATSQSITILPSDLYAASRLVVTDITPTTPGSGESFTVTVESQNSFGDAVPVTQATIIGVSIDNPYLVVDSGSTQATVQAGESGTTLTLTVNSTSTANVTAVLTVSSPDLSATSQSITILPSDLYVASRLVVTDITPTMPGSGESFTVTVESQNSFGEVVPVTQATIIGISIDNPYLVVGTGNTQATVQAGESGTTLTLTVNSTSTANVTAVLTVSSPDLSTTSQSITILPSDLYVASRLVVTDITPTTPGSGESFTVTVESQNSFGEVVPVTQATIIGISIDNPYLTFGSGNTQATVQAGESGTTLTLTVNSTSTANVTAVLTVSSPDLSATSQSITILPSDLYVASHLVVTDITPTMPGSGESFTVTVESQNSFGDVVPVTQATIIGISIDNPYLVVDSGNTQATVQAGESGTTLTLTVNSTSTANVTAVLTVSSPDLSATSQSITILPSDLYAASRLVVTDITPTMPGSGESFTVTVESQNSFGDVVPVTRATIIGVSIDNPYLVVGSGNTQTTVQAGESGTTLTLTVNSTSTASVTASLLLSASGMSSTSESITITPVLSFVASRLAVAEITPSTPGSGEVFTITVEVQNEFGQAVPVTQATAINVAFNDSYLTLASGSTQAILQTGQNSISLLLRLYNSSTSSITTTVVVAADDLSSTSQTITIGGNNAPFISTMIDVSTNEDTPVSSTFTISDIETPVSEFTVTATSDNPILVPDSHLLLSSTAASMTLLINPALNQSGSANITLTVSDGIRSSMTTFTLTVYPVNDLPIAFDDTDTVCANSSTVLMPLMNDMDMDGDTIVISNITQGIHGSVQILSSTSVVYTPNQGYSGNDFFSYTITDANSDTATAIVHLNVRTPIPVNAGTDTSIFVGSSVQLQASGGVSYSWSPATGLNNTNVSNPIASPMQTTAYIVTVTDLNGCQARDTVVVTVRGRDLNVAVMLQGAYDGSTGEMSTQLQAQGLIPSTQPYSMAPFSYNGSETAPAMPVGIVDWLLVELRSTMAASSVVSRQAVLLREDGTLANAQGLRPTIADSVPSGEYYVVVYHRNHLGVMSASPVTVSATGLVYTFTTSNSQAYRDFYDPMVQINPGVYGLLSGDANVDTIINAIDRATVRNATGETGYLATDLNLDGIINAVDRIIVRNNTFAVSQVPQ